MATQTAWQVAQNIITETTAATYGIDWESFVSQAAANGWTAVKNDAGNFVGYSKVFWGGSQELTGGEESALVTAASTAATGAAVTGGGVLSTIAVPAFAVAAAAAMGLTVGTALYDATPDFWQGLLDKLLTDGYTIGQQAVVLLKNGKTYAPVGMLQDTADWLIGTGAYVDSTSIISGNYTYPIENGPCDITFGYQSTSTITSITIYHIPANCIVLLRQSSREPTVTGAIPIDYIYIFSAVSQNYTEETYYKYSTGQEGSHSTSTYPISASSQSQQVTINGTAYNYFSKQSTINDLISGATAAPYTYPFGWGGTDDWDTFKTIIEGGTVISGTVTGVTKQSGATVPVTGTPITTTYPDWNTQAISQYADSTQQNDYLPLTLTYSGTDTQPATSSENNTEQLAQAGTATNSTLQDKLMTQLQELLDELADKQGLTGTTSPPSANTGTSPTPTAATGTAVGSGMIAVYNPSLSIIQSFGAWLWSADFIDNIKKIFNNPMDAIIGLHMVYATPSVAGNKTIKVGYLDTAINSPYIGTPYTDIDCGEISLAEYFGNIEDYEPYTEIYIYLPFVGIEKLDTNSVMRSKIHVIYHVDVLSGAVLAEIRILRDDSNGIIYTFQGNCAVQLPISAGNYGSMITSLVSAGAGIAATVMSGGTLGPVALMGAGMTAMHGHTSVQHSGSISGNAGAMGVKIPYLIINRDIPHNALNYPSYYGYPAADTVQIGSLSGFAKIKAIITSIGQATDAEKTEIMSLLNGGVYL